MSDFISGDLALATLGGAMNTRMHAPDFRWMVSCPIHDHVHVDSCCSHPTDVVTSQTGSDQALR